MPLSKIPTRPKKVAGNAASESTASQMNSIPRRISQIPRLGISNAKPKIDTGLSSARRNAKQVRISEEAPEPSTKPTVTRATTSTPPTPTTWVPKRTGTGYASTFRTTNKPTGIPLLNRTIKKPAIKGPTKALREISPGVEILKSVSTQLKKSVEDINPLLSSQAALGDCISRTPVVESLVKQKEPVKLEDIEEEEEEEEELKVIFKKEILQEIIAYCDDINVTPMGVEPLDQVAQPNLIDLEYDFKKQFEPDNMDPGTDVEDSLLEDWVISEDVASVPKVVDEMQVTNELQDMDSTPKLHVVFVDEDIPDNVQQRDLDHSSLLLLAYPPVELDSAPTKIDETKSLEQVASMHLKEELQEIRSDAKMAKSCTHTSVSRKDSRPSIYEFDGFMNMDNWVFSPEPIKHDFVVDAPTSSVSSDPPTSQIEHETVVASTSSASTDQGDIVEASLQDLSKTVVNVPSHPTVFDNLDKIEAELALKLQTALSLDMNHNVSEEHAPQEEKVNVETCTVKRESEHEILIPQQIQFYNFNYHQHFVSEVPIRNFGDKPLAFKVNDFNPTSRYQIRPEYGIVPAFGQERFNIQILFQAGDKYDEILHTDVQVFLAEASSLPKDSNTSLKDYWLELMQNNVKVSRCEIKQIIMNDVFNYATLNPPRTGLNVDYLPPPPPTDGNKNDAPLEIAESTVDEILNGRNLNEIMWKGTKTVQKEMQKVVDIRKQMGICINGVCIIASTILCMGLVQKNYCGFVNENLDLEPEKIGYLASMWHFIFGY